MSARTWSKTGSSTSSAGGRSPHWCSSAASPSVFSATVLPPGVRPRDHDRAELAGLEVDRHGGGGVEQRMPRSSQDDAAAPRHAPRATAGRGRRTRGRGRSRRRRRRASTMPSAWSPTARESSRRIRATSSRSALSASRRPVGVARRPRTARRTASAPSPSCRGRCRVPRRARRPEREDGPAGALGDEVLREVLAQRRVARERAEALGDPGRAPRAARAGAGGAPATRCRAGRSRRPRPPGRSAGDAREPRIDAARERASPGAGGARLDRDCAPRSPCRSRRRSPCSAPVRARFRAPRPRPRA